MFQEMENLPGPGKEISTNKGKVYLTRSNLRTGETWKGTIPISEKEGKRICEENNASAKEDHEGWWGYEVIV